MFTTNIQFKVSYIIIARREYMKVFLISVTDIKIRRYFCPKYIKVKVFIIGAGNVAYHMVRAIWKTDHEVVGLFSRKEREAKSCVRGEKVDLFHDLAKIPDTADVYLLCVNDDAIPEVSRNLPEIIRTSKIVAHTSGSQPIEALENVDHRGIFYPVQTFTKGRKMQYSGIPICINASESKTEEQLINLGENLSGEVVTITDEDRKQIHLSAVMVNNFVNHLIYKAEDLLENHGLPTDILQPLLQQTIAKLNKIGSHDAQTGPAVRNDKQTIARHLDLLTNEMDKNLYQAISNSITETYLK